MALSRQSERAHKHRILHKRRQTNRGRRQERVHDPFREGRLDALPQRLANECESSSENDRFRMKQVYCMRERVGEALGSLVQNCRRLEVTRLQRGLQKPGLPLVQARFANALRKAAARIALRCLANLPVNAPAGAKIFSDAASPFQAEMPQLHFSRRRTVIDRPIHHKTASDSAPSIHPQNRIATRTRTMNRLSQSRGVCIVLYENSQPGGLIKPRSKGKIAPARNMIRLGYLPGTPVHRAPVPNSNRAHAMRGDELRNRLGYFFTNALGAPRAVYLVPLPPEDHTVSSSNNQLQLCSPDLDADEAPTAHRLWRRNGL